MHPDYRTNRNCLFVFRIKMFLNKCLKSADTFLFSCKAKIVASCLVHPAVFLNCFKHLVPGTLLAPGKPGHTHFPVSHGQNGLKVKRASHYHARCGQASSLLEIKKCVYNQINADLLFFYFNNLLRCLSFLSEGKCAIQQKLCPQRCLHAVDYVNPVIFHNIPGNKRALAGTAKLARKKDAYHIVSRFFSLPEILQKCFRRGLACRGQFLR